MRAVEKIREQQRRQKTAGSRTSSKSAGGGKSSKEQNGVVCIRRPLGTRKETMCDKEQSLTIDSSGIEISNKTFYRATRVQVLHVFSL